MMQGKIIDINNFNTDTLVDAIEEYRLDFEDTSNVKAELSKPKYIYHRKSWLNGNIASTNTSCQGKTVVVCPYLMSS